MSPELRDLRVPNANNLLVIPILWRQIRSSRQRDDSASAAARGDMWPGGYATIVIKKPGGRTRAIFFRMGWPIGADVSESEGRLDFTATRERDLHRIRVGNERYEIPDAVIFGG